MPRFMRAYFPCTFIPTRVDDSLHHTLLTEMTPSLESCQIHWRRMTVTLEHYHLGLYALTAPLKMLANIPADKALLWMAQFLNGLCGIGVFLFLEKGITLCGNYWHDRCGFNLTFSSLVHNWGRFTLVRSQTILPAIIVTTWYPPQ